MVNHHCCASEPDTDLQAGANIAKRSAADVLFYASHPDRIPQRLNELDCEWDLDRILEAGTGWAILGGTVLGLFSRKYRLLSWAAAGFLLQKAYRGWAPPGELLRRFGVRTRTEIDRERCALKALRGDFAEAKADSPEQALAKADKVLAASGIET